MKSRHEDIKHACTQCDSQANTQGNQKLQIKSKHEGVKYSCNECNYQASRKVNRNLV